MTHELDGSIESPMGAARPSRRTLLRTAGTTAWAAPVIVVATSAPALAASPGTSSFTVSDGTTTIAPTSPLEPRSLTMTLTVSRPGGDVYILAGEGLTGVDGWTTPETGLITSVITYTYQGGVTPPGSAIASGFRRGRDGRERRIRLRRHRHGRGRRVLPGRPAVHEPAHLTDLDPPTDRRLSGSVPRTVA